MKLVPHLWYKAEALEAAEFYTSLIEGGKIHWVHKMSDTPSGEVALVSFQLANLDFGAISAGDTFQLNESISLMLRCKTREEVERIYKALLEGGRELMAFGAYDFCPLYGWLADRYGLNWQVMLDESLETKHHIDLCFLFDQAQTGKAYEALEKFQTLFTGAEIGQVSYYDGSQPVQKAKINYGELIVDGFRLVAMDHGYGGYATFNEAFSLMLLCETDEEIEALYEKLSYDKSAEQCGWVKDEYGILWQIVPKRLIEAYTNLDEATLKRLQEAVLQSKRLSVGQLDALIGEKSW